MSEVLSEKQYQRFIIDYLTSHNGYIERKDSNFDRYFAMDRQLVLNFLYDTQPKEMTALNKILKSDFEEKLINTINQKIVTSSLLDCLKHGIDINNVHLNLMYAKPATSFNKDLNKKFEQNIFSIAEEVYAKDDERIDLVIFLNGFAIISFELKCNASGQNYENAIKQYRNERDPESRLFRFKAGCIVNFAMDLEEAYMTTKLNHGATYFLPFNRGKGTGVNVGKGNPLNPDGFGVSYMWEDILTKETILELISKFVFLERIEKKDGKGKKKIKETVIFPRYHQLNCIRKSLKDVKENGTLNNYLIQHSAGSGKTYTIAWLAHRLATLHNDEDKIIFDNVVIVTDRVVVDRQLQKAVQSLEHKTGFIRVMDDKCSSDDLRLALEGNTKIIATTIQKFLYIADIVQGLKNKTFAVLIDEAHSSTSGKDMAAVTKALGSDVDYEEDAYNMDAEDIIADEIGSHGKQSNVSMFAFTATPKATTLELFGTINKNGLKEAFDLYSMKQAIEEGFILDVLQSYTPYKTFFKINKKIEEDPKYQSKKAKKKIFKFAMLHDENIAQRTKIIVEHFRNNVMEELGGQARAMVVTGSRAEAVKYFFAFNDYLNEMNYSDLKTMVAFSGKISEKQVGISDDKDKYMSESSLNGISEEDTPLKFDMGDYRIMLVANKYQTGFDQPKLCAMYVMKKLTGVNAVQTLSRLNRIYPPYEKKTFILDFVNTYEDMEEAFKPYFTTTLLSKSVTPDDVYGLDAKIDGFYIFSFEDAEEANKIFYDTTISSAKREQRINYYLSKAHKAFDALDVEDRKEAYKVMRKFVKFYEFLIQASSFSDADLHKKYKFIVWLLPYLKPGQPGDGFDLKGKIDASDFYQKKGQEVVKPKHTSDPNIGIGGSTVIELSKDEEERLSEIIREVNSKTGKSFDNDVATKAALQIKDILMKNEDLIAAAKSNDLDNFKLAYFKAIEDALVAGLEQNKDFFTLLLNNEVFRKEILGIFVSEIYKILRGEKKDDQGE